MKGKNNARKSRLVKETIGRLLGPNTCGRCANWDWDKENSSWNKENYCAYSFGAGAGDIACSLFVQKESKK